MAGEPVVHIGENSPEEVAYRLLERVAYLEDKRINGAGDKAKPDRKWLLDTYAECIEAVRGYRAKP